MFLETLNTVSMIKINNNDDINYDALKNDNEWNEGNEKELLMHTIHTYPAKFPPFVVSNAFKYAKNEGVLINKVSDFFCGCGTVALEAKEHNYDFWGCDINPVGVLISRVKCYDYDIDKLEYYYNLINKESQAMVVDKNEYTQSNERIQYWFSRRAYNSLLKIYKSIEHIIDEKIYKEAFECIFSSILKASSRWLTKSIKPQIDLNKKEINVEGCFRKQYNKFLKAVSELKGNNSHTNIRIDCKNFLTYNELPKVDLVVTSPPYVTSYEYADLLQLSSLWLNYTDDYRLLRKGTIGSIYNHNEENINYNLLNSVGGNIIDSLLETECPKSKIRSIAKYYIDMQNVIKQSYSMLNKNGMIVFVIGDTEYKGVKLLNSKHLVETLRNEGFCDIKIGKRRISKGICVPFRDEKGRFSRNKSQKHIYQEEYIISGRRFV